MKNLLITLLAVTAITASCKKDKVIVSNTPVYSATAKVKYGGDPAADGSGWHLFKNNAAAPVFCIPIICLIHLNYRSWK